MTDQPPLYRAYTVVERDNGSPPFWLNIGSAFPHKDGNGFNVMLQALPVNARLVLRLYGEPLTQDTPDKLAPKSKKKIDQNPEPA